MAAKLILSMDGLVLKEIPLSKERTTIGRKPHNDIQIDNLAISGEHAVIVTILNDSFLEDLNSTNGTYVNGQPIKKHFLQNSDVIELGKYRLKYVAEQTQVGAGAADYEKTMVLRPGAMHRPGGEAPPPPAPPPRAFTDTQAGMRPAATQPPRSPLAPGQPGTAAPPGAGMAAGSAGTGTAPPRSMPGAPGTGSMPLESAMGGRGTASVPPGVPLGGAQRAPAAPAAGAGATLRPGSVGVIQLLTGANAGKELELTKTLTTVGKPTVQVAVITRRPQGYFITHVEGASFPIVNGKTLDAQAHPLGDHDVIELAGVKMEFFLRG
jgi:hypothetical protein